jgi:hypothetical protein
MTFLTVLAWTGAIVLVLVVLAFIAFCVYLGRAAIQERRLSRLEAEATEAELQSDEPLFAPRTSRLWPFSGDDLNNPQEGARDTSPE